MKKSRKALPTDPSHTRKHLNWQLDADYLAKLSPSELAWYEQFTGEYYRNYTGEGLLTQEEKRERWRAEKANRKDIKTRSGVDGRADEIHEWRRYIEEIIASTGHTENKAIERLDQERALEAAEKD